MIWLFLLALAGASPVSESFESANQAFASHDYLEAERGYHALLARGAESGPVFYNLGNSQLQRGQLGQAIASYRQAQIYWPRRADLRHNLDFARNSSKAMAAPAQPHSLVRWLFFWRYWLSPSEFRWLFVMVNAMFWLSALAYIHRPGGAMRRMALLSLAVPFVLVGSSLGLRSTFPSQIGVVLAESTKAYAEPRETGSVNFVIREGTELWWADVSDDWVWVALSDGRSGWTSARDLALLRL